MGASHSLWSAPLAALGTILGILPIHLHKGALAEAAGFRTRLLLWDRWDGMGNKRENGHRRSLDDCLNQHCPIQFLTDVGSRKNNWVQNVCIQHPRVQIFTDASKRDNNTSYAFLASRGEFVIGEGDGAFGNTSVFQAEIVAIHGLSQCPCIKDVPPPNNNNNNLDHSMTCRPTAAGKNGLHGQKCLGSAA